MSTETEKKTILIESEKDPQSYEKYKKKMIKFLLWWGLVIVLGCVLHYGICNNYDDDVIAMYSVLVILLFVVEFIAYFSYWFKKWNYYNVKWIIDNEGFREIHANITNVFIPVQQICSVSHLIDVVRIISTDDTIMPKSLYFLKNASEMKAVLDDLIYKTDKEKEVMIKENNDASAEIKKYKELLDSGVITQEEFDAKKKQLLNL